MTKEAFTKSKARAPPPVRGTAGDYYKLRAMFSNTNEIIYTPVDMAASMRPLISSGEAANYLELFARLEPHAFHPGKAMDLEPIPKLAMNANEFTPDNNSAGKLKQSHVVDSFLLIANQKFAEAIEKRVSHLNDPAACAKVRVALQLLLLLTPGPNMRNIFALFNCLCAAGIPCV